MDDYKSIALIVDDDLGFVFWFGEMFIRSGYEVVPALSCREARSLLKKLDVRVDLALVDPMLPGAVRMLRWLKQANLQIRIIFIRYYWSGYRRPLQRGEWCSSITSAGTAIWKRKIADPSKTDQGPIDSSAALVDRHHAVTRETCRNKTPKRRDQKGLNMPTKGELQAEVDRLRAENEALKEGKHSASLSMKVSVKGAVSVYGLGRFPVTLYEGQWLKLFAAADEIRRFIEANRSSLKTRE